MNTTYIFLILLILCWTINPFLKKQIASKMSSSEYMIYNHGLCSFLVVIYLGYLLYTKKYDVSSIKNLTNKEVGVSIIGAITTVLATILLIRLLKDNNASYVIPHVQPCIIIFTLLLGYFLYNENISKTQMLGIILVVSGIVVINYKN